MCVVGVGDLFFNEAGFRPGRAHEVTVPIMFCPRVIVAVAVAVAVVVVLVVVCAVPLFDDQYLELLSEHEDLLQLLAQQELVKTTLINALEVREDWGEEGGTLRCRLAVGFFSRSDWKTVAAVTKRYSRLTEIACWLL